MPRVVEILIVEDNRAEIELIRDGLQRFQEIGMNVRVATDGEEAFRILLDRSYRPDIILLDLAVPKIDGATVIQRVRTAGVPLNNLPIVVFGAGQHSIQEIIHSGGTVYINKPHSLTEYLKAIERFMILWVKPLAATAN